MNTYIELFAGIGGFRQALDKHGLECVFASEIDEDAQDAYEANYGDRPSGDIQRIAASEIPDHDILTGGFPCQSFSVAGARTGFSDDRGNLFYDIIRIAREKRPKLLLLENVPHILAIEGQQAIAVIRREIENIGYRFNYALLNSCYYGSPQSRERVYFWCFRDDYRPDVSDIRFESRPAVYFSEIKEDEKDVDEWHYLKGETIENTEFFFSRWENRAGLLFETDGYKDYGAKIVGYVNTHKYWKTYDTNRIYLTTANSPTVTTMRRHVGCFYIGPDRYRRMTNLEAKRCQGFPDDFYIGTDETRTAYEKGYKLVGNAVIPEMISIVYTEALKSIGRKI